MAENLARDALASYLPERWLIQRRNIGALAYKYDAKGKFLLDQTRLSALTRRQNWQSLPQEPLDILQRRKFIGGLVLLYDDSSHVYAHDPERPEIVTTPYKRRDLQLHARFIKGRSELQEDLQATARYISQHSQLYNAPKIIGATYPPLAATAQRLYGFRPMQTTGVEGYYADNIHYLHTAFQAVHHRPLPEYTGTVSTVYMPTTEFVKRYGG
jgi:hypothetical protein